MELTIAVYSACIAAVITIFQFVLPNALALILTGALSEEESAVTWSVVSRFFLSSDWPLFLRSESATGDGVSKKISLVVWTKPVTLLIIAIAAVVTPLGLYDEIVPGRSAESVKFTYVADSSLFGAGTPARSSRGFHFSRACSGYLCPGDANKGNITQLEVYNRTTNATMPQSYYVESMSINPALIDLYQSGSKNSSPSLSGYFDIQARQWSMYVGDFVENNATLLQAGFKYLSPVWMDNKIVLVEGLIVDAKSGGIGFRNHSVPLASAEYGMEWEEDILWMQPETSCVDTNLTISFTGPSEGIGSLYGSLVDRGGFCNLEKMNPYYTPENSTRPYVFADGQTNPFLYERAYFLAWGTNAVIMEYLNVTDPKTNRSRVSSKIGQAFKVNGSFTTFYRTDDDLFKLVKGSSNQLVALPWSTSWNSSTKKYDYDNNPLIPNPHNITVEALYNHRYYCKGASGGDPVNISRLDIGIGFIAAPGRSLNTNNLSAPSSNQTWERPYYSCASATKTSIKTVRLRYNGTREPMLNDLQIVSIKDKIYGSDAEKPIWGFETPWLNETRTWNLSKINPLWGIMDPSLPLNRNITTIRSDRFYIPASYETSASIGWANAYNYRSYTPGTSGPAWGWGSIYEIYSSSISGIYASSDPQQERFIMEMTSNSTITAKMLNLMWTDTMANSLVGTRGVHQPKYQPLVQQRLTRRDTINLASLPDSRYPVYFLQRQVHYKWIYAIPALIALGIITCVVLLALVSMMFGHGTITRLRWYMFNITSGRVLASFVYSENANVKSRGTKKWLDSVGRRTVVISDHVARSGSQPTRVKGKGSEYIELQQIDENESMSSREQLHKRA